MNRKKLIYIAVPASAVFRSQVVEFLIEVEKNNYFDDIVLFIGVKKGATDKGIGKLLGHTKILVKTFKMFPNYHFYTQKQVNALSKCLNSELTENCVIHTRDESLSKVAKMAIGKVKNEANAKILTDVRGARFEESLIYNKIRPIQHQLKLYQHFKNRKSINYTSDSVSCVSHKLKEYLINKAKVNEDKIYVNHCIANDSFIFSKDIRTEYRSKLKVAENETLFLFITGSGGKWQNTKNIIESISKKGYKILNLSKTRIELNNVINLFVPYEDVPKYINAADIGIIWRNNDVVNNVASPVKFSEYVCAGLPIIANNGVNLINDYIDETGFGKTLNNFEELDEEDLIKIKSLDREKISNYSRGVFSSKIIVENYIRIYSKLLSN